MDAEENSMPVTWWHMHSLAPPTLGAPMSSRSCLATVIWWVCPRPPLHLSPDLGGFRQGSAAAPATNFSGDVRRPCGVAGKGGSASSLHFPATLAADNSPFTPSPSGTSAFKPRSPTRKKLISCTASYSDIAALARPTDILACSVNPSSYQTAIARAGSDAVVPAGWVAVCATPTFRRLFRR